MKKLISVLLIFTMVFTISVPRKVFAIEGTESLKMEDVKIDKDEFLKDAENGYSTVKGNGDKGYNVESGTVNTLVKGVVIMFSVLPMMVRLFIDVITKDNYVDGMDARYGTDFSIQKLVFDKVSFLQVDFFSNNQGGNILRENISKNVATCYAISRTIAIVFLLILLIYTGVRMAMASIASEKVKYKTMLLNWLYAMLLLVMLPYIMILINSACSMLLDLCEDIMVQVCGDEIFEIESKILDLSINSSKGMLKILIPTLIFWMITFYQIKFFWMYSKRMFSVIILIVISPLVLVQYAFDKAGDNKASSYKVWLKEYMINLLIQPLHAVMYMIFMSLASNIITIAPILSVICLGALSRAERVLRNIFGVKKSASLSGMSDTLKAESIAKLG